LRFEPVEMALSSFIAAQQASNKSIGDFPGYKIENLSVFIFPQNYIYFTEVCSKDVLQKNT